MKTKLPGILGTMGFLVGITLLTGARAQAQPAAWLNPAWGFRNTITVGNSTGAALSDYQVRIVLDSSFAFANARADGADLRVTAADGVTLLPYWMETWSPATGSARIWARVPSIPTTGTSLYVYYGNAAATAASSGPATFDFFDDFDTDNALQNGYYTLSEPLAQPLLLDQAWETAPPHTMSVVEMSPGNYRAYYGLASGCGGVGIADSTDLTTWTKSPNNPILSSARWPSVQIVNGTYYMAYDKNYCQDVSIVLASSSDGVHFTDVKTLVTAQPGLRNQNPHLWVSPVDGQFYLYYYHGNDLSSFEIRVRHAAAVTALDTAPEVTLLTSSISLAAPNMMYADGTYFLATESRNPVTGFWETPVYSSSSPTGGFTLLPGNPVLQPGACMFQHPFGNTLHEYYCDFDHTNEIWTMQHRTANLVGGRSILHLVNPSRWTAAGGNWTIVSDLQQDGTNGRVLRGSTTTRQFLSSASFSGSDYTVEAYGKQAGGNVWGLAARIQDANNLYSFNLYETLDSSANLYFYNWQNGIAGPVANGAIGNVDLDTWYKLTVKVHGTAIDVSKDDVPALTASDPTRTSGPIAVYGESATIAEFNNIVVRKYAAVEPATTVGAVSSYGSAIPSSVTVSPASVAGGASSTGTVTLSPAAPAGGATVTLASSDTAAAQVPASVLVPAGSTQATFPITTSSVTITAAVSISATLNGATQTAALTVNAPPPVPVSVTLSPATIPGGGTVTGTVTLSGLAPAGGAVVTLSSSNTSAAQTPATVTVPAAATSTTFPITTSAVAAATPVTITATSASVSQTAALTVQPSTGLAWLDYSWPYRRAVAISNAGGTALTNFQVKVTLDASFSFAQARADGTDLRVTSVDGVTLLPYWIESWNPALQTATLWVRVPALPAAGATVYLYYGNPAASTSVSNGEQTFDFFDDFNAASINAAKWTASGGAWSTVSDTQPDGSTGLVARGVTGARQVLSSSFTGTDYVVQAHGKQVAGRVWGLGVRSSAAGANVYSVNLYEDLDAVNNLYMYRWANNAVGATPGIAATGLVNLNSWYKLEVKVHGTGIDVYKDDVLRIQAVDSGLTSGGVALYGEGGTTAQWNNVFVRQYAAVEPVAVVGGATSSGVPILASVTVSPTSVVGGAGATGTVTLSAAAPAGGAAVSLSSSNSTTAQVPASVTVPENTTSVTFAVTTAGVAATTVVTVHGSYNGSTQDGTLTLLAPPPAVASVSTTPASILGGGTVSGTVTLTSPAPAGGVLVTLASGNPAAVQLPASVTVPENQLTVTFTIVTSPVTAATPVTLTATYGASSGQTVLTVNPPGASPWYNPSWLYRSAVTVANGGGSALTGYQVNVTLGASFDFSRVRLDGADLLFTASDGVTPLPFWIERWNPAQQTASLWVRIPTVGAGGETVFLYYGNQFVTTSTASGDQTFDFFDDFSSATINAAKWTASGGTWTAASTAQPDGTTGSVANGVTNARQVLSSSFTGTDYVVQVHGRQVGGRVWGLGVRGNGATSLYSVNLYNDRDALTNLFVYTWVNNGVTAVPGSAAVGIVDSNTWYKLMVKVHGSAIEVYKDGVLSLQGTDTSLSSGRISLYGEAGTTAQFNDVFVRKYAAVEPAASVGPTIFQ